MYLYILYSKKINKYYIGCSNTPDIRLAYHNKGKASKFSFTKRAGDWEKVFEKFYLEDSLALLEEKRLKKAKNRVYLEKYIQNNQ